MEELIFYYRLNTDAIDSFDEREVTRENRVLKNFDDLRDPLFQLKAAFDARAKSREQIFVCLRPKDAERVDNILEIFVYHKYESNFLSKQALDGVYHLGLLKGPDSMPEAFDFETEDFAYVQKVFSDYIVHHKGPDLRKWIKYPM